MKAILRKLLCTATALVMAISFMTVAVYAASPKISKSSVDLPIGYYITLKVSGASGNITWSSGDSEVAAVKSSGENSAKVTGKKTGTTYIYAKTGGQTLKCKVTVKQSFISSSKNTVEVNAGNSAAVTLTVTGSKSIVVSNSDKSVCTTSWGKWSDNKIKLTINAKNAGTAKLKIYAKGYSSSTAQTITVKVSGKDSEVSAASDVEDEVIKLVNKEREAKGLSALVKDDTLSKVADLRVKEIVEKFSHTRPDGSKCFTAFEDAGIVNVYMAENIAMGQKDASEVMDSWMNSAGHKSNIMNSNFTRMGLSCYESGGRKYWVQVFSSDY